MLDKQLIASISRQRQTALNIRDLPCSCLPQRNLEDQFHSLCFELATTRVGAVASCFYTIIACCAAAAAESLMPEHGAYFRLGCL